MSGHQALQEPLFCPYVLSPSYFRTTGPNSKWQHLYLFVWVLCGQSVLPSHMTFYSKIDKKLTWLPCLRTGLQTVTDEHGCMNVLVSLILGRVKSEAHFYTDSQSAPTGLDSRCPWQKLALLASFLSQPHFSLPVGISGITSQVKHILCALRSLSQVKQIKRTWRHKVTTIHTFQ